MKKIQEKNEWLIEGGTNENPFLEKKRERDLVRTKEKVKQMKNEENRNKDKLKKDKSYLSKTLETVQKSTASRGKFDKTLKNEKTKIDKKVKRELLDKGNEKKRNSSLVTKLLKKK